MMPEPIYDGYDARELHLFLRHDPTRVMPLIGCKGGYALDGYDPKIPSMMGMLQRDLHLMRHHLPTHPAGKGYDPNNPSMMGMVQGIYTC
eukprot:3928734-Amphidinium_carterae.1